MKPLLVNLAALFIRLFTTCCKRTLSVVRYFLSLSGIRNTSSTPGGIFKRWESWTVFNNSGRLCSANINSMVPDSIRDKSRISLIKASNRPQFLLMVPINWAISSLVKPLVSLSKSEKPTIAFNGVRISWLMLARNADFSLSAWRALSRASLISCSAVLYRWILWQTPNILYNESCVNPVITEERYSHHSYSPLTFRWRKFRWVLESSPVNALLNNGLISFKSSG